MLASVLSTLVGSIASLFLLALGLLPTIDVSSLPILLPAPVTQALSALNWFIPFGTLVSVMTLWIGLLLAYNTFLMVFHIVQSLTKG